MPRQKGTPHRAHLEGQKFNRLFVIERVAGSLWKCKCDCGLEVYVSTYQLKSEKTKSCGCWSREKSTKHGMEKTAVYTTWAQMLSRCRNPKNKYYKDYGGRGIQVCERWLDFRNFYSDMGDKPDGMSIDRIDNDSGYSPENCRWADTKQQIRNRRMSPKFEWQGEVRSLAELSEQHGLPWRRVYERIRSGWDIKKALLTPIGLTGPKK